MDDFDLLKGHMQQLAAERKAELAPVMERLMKLEALKSSTLASLELQTAAYDAVCKELEQQVEATKASQAKLAAAEQHHSKVAQQLTTVAEETAAAEAALAAEQERRHATLLRVTAVTQEISAEEAKLADLRTEQQNLVHSQEQAQADLDALTSRLAAIAVESTNLDQQAEQLLENRSKAQASLATTETALQQCNAALSQLQVQLQLQEDRHADAERKLKDLELASADLDARVASAGQTSDLHEALTAAETESANLRTQLEASKKELADQTEDLAQARLRAEKADSLCETLQAAQDGHTTTIASLRAELETAKTAAANEADSLGQQLKDAQERAERFVLECSNLQKSNTSFVTMVASLEEELARAKSAGNESSTLRQQLKDAQERAEQSVLECSNLQNSNINLKAMTASLEEELAVARTAADEAGSLRQQLKDLEEKARTAADEAGSLRQQLKDLEEKAEQSVLECSNLQNSNTSLKAMVTSLEEELAAARTAADESRTLRQQLKDSEERAQQSVLQCSKLEDSNTSLKTMVASLEEELAAARTAADEASSLRLQLKDLEERAQQSVLQSSKLEDSNTSLKTMVASLEEELAAARTAADEANSLRQQLKSSEEKAEQSVLECSNLQNSTTSLKTLVASLEEELAVARTAADENSALRQQLKDFKESAEQSALECSNLQNSNASLKTMVASLEEKLAVAKTAADEASSLREQLKNSQERAEQSVLDYSELENSNTSLKSTVASLEKELAVARTAADEDGSLRQQLKDSQERAEQSVLECHNLENSNANLKSMVASLEEELAAARTAADEACTLRQHLEDSKKRAEHAAQECSSLKESQSGYECMVAKLQEGLAALQGELAVARTAADEVTAMRQELDDTQQRAERAAVECSDLQTSNSKFKEMVATLEAELAAARAAVADASALRQQVKDSQEEAQRALLECSSLNDSRDSFKVMVATLEEELTAARAAANDANALSQQLRDSQERAEQAALECSTLRESKNGYENMVATLREGLAALQQELTAAQSAAGDANVLRQQLEDAQERAAHAALECSNLQTSKNTFEAMVASLEGELAAARAVAQDDPAEPRPLLGRSAPQGPVEPDAEKLAERPATSSTAEGTTSPDSLHSTIGSLQSEVAQLQQQLAAAQQNLLERDSASATAGGEERRDLCAALNDLKAQLEAKDQEREAALAAERAAWQLRLDETSSAGGSRRSRRHRAGLQRLASKNAAAKGSSSCPAALECLWDVSSVFARTAVAAVRSVNSLCNRRLRN